MTIEETREKILTEDNFVLDETKKIQYLYGLQKVIRNHLKRDEDPTTESVAEHVHAMSVLTHYFAPLEDTEQKLNHHTIHTLITWHDIDEIETGDVIGYLKTDADRAAEHEAQKRVLKQAPASLRANIDQATTEYKQQETTEAKFVKAIDKLDPVFYLYNENGYKLFKLHNATKEQHCRIKEPYLKNFPYMYRFYQIVTKQLESEGFFC